MAALAIVIGFGAAAHSGCATSGCPTDEQPTTTQQATEVTLERRIGDALKDLEIFNARALKVDAQAKDGTLERRIEDSLKDLESATTRTLKADEERLNALARQITGVSR